MYKRIWKLPDWGVDSEVYESPDIPKTGIIKVRRTTWTGKSNQIVGKTAAWEWAEADNIEPTSATPIIAVLTEDHPEYTFWDYDVKGTLDKPLKKGKELFELHDWNGAYTYTTKSNGYRVVTHRVNLPTHPYAHTEYAEALEIFNSDIHRWIAIPPTQGYGAPKGSVGKAIALDIPTAGTTAVLTAQPRPQVVWTPTRVNMKLPKKRTYRRTQHSDSPAVPLCDTEFCGPFYRKVNGQWRAVTRHGEVESLAWPWLGERLANRAVFGPKELNELFTIWSWLNDEFTCGRHPQKFANDAAIEADILRILHKRGARFYSASLEAPPYEEIVHGIAMKEPHEIQINGRKRSGKSRLAMLIAAEIAKALGGRVAYMTRDETAADVLRRDPTAFVVSQKDSTSNIHNYVFDPRCDALEQFERFVSVLPSDVKVAIIEPANVFRTKWQKIHNEKDDYTAAYDCGDWMIRTLGIHMITSWHTRKPVAVKEDIHALGAYAALGTAGTPGSTRFGLNVGDDHTVSFWGNNHPDDWIEDEEGEVRWALIEHKKNVHYSLRKGDFSGDTLWEVNNEDNQGNV